MLSLLTTGVVDTEFTIGDVTAINVNFGKYVTTSVADQDPEPPDPHAFGPPGSGSGSFYHHAKIVRKTLIPTIL